MWRSFCYDENEDTIDSYILKVKQVASLLNYGEPEILELFKTHCLASSGQQRMLKPQDLEAISSMRYNVSLQQSKTGKPFKPQVYQRRGKRSEKRL